MKNWSIFRTRSGWFALRLILIYIAAKFPKLREDKTLTLSWVQKKVYKTCLNTQIYFAGGAEVKPLPHCQKRNEIQWGNRETALISS